MRNPDWDRGSVVRIVKAERPIAPRRKLALRKQKEIREWLLKANGWSADSFGHLQKEAVTPSGVWKLRLKFAKQVVRLERKRWRGDWVRIRSEYYGKLTEEQLLGWPNVV